MFKNVTLWCEFPDKVDWEKAIKLIDFKVKVYLAVSSKKEFLEYQKKIESKNITLGAWPILPKKEGYWFSGYTCTESIDKLKQFKGMDIKIDLEPPIPQFEYSDFSIAAWFIGLLFKKAENKEYLKAVMYWLADHNTKILVNEFPLPKIILNKMGITTEKHKNMTLQLMLYTSPVARPLRPLVRLYNRIMLKRALKNNPHMSGSIGLIGPGILETEGIYKDVNEFVKDLKMASEAGLENIVIYSLDTILKRENPKEWIRTLKSFISSSC